MIPEQALKAGAYAMFKRSIETLPPEKQALYGSWYEHNEAGANEEFEIAAGIIIQAALPHVNARILDLVRADLRAEAMIQGWVTQVFEHAATYTPDWYQKQEAAFRIAEEGTTK